MHLRVEVPNLKLSAFSYTHAIEGDNELDNSSIDANDHIIEQLNLDDILEERKWEIRH